MTANAALYQRVSDGTDKSVEDQNRENEEAAHEFGWRTVTFSDAVSASRFSKKARPGWVELTAAVAAGRFSYVVLWEVSRADRKAGGWTTFLDACRATRTRIYVTGHARLFDPAEGYDRRELLAEGIDAEFESEKISKRAKRGVAGAIALGLPTGRIPYGYRRYYTHKPGRRKPLQHQEPDPREAPIAKEIITRIAADEAVSAILHDFAKRGVRTRADGKWSRASITRLVLEGTVYIGKRRNNGGPLRPGNWLPIVDEATYWKAVRVLSDPARKTAAGKRGGIRPGAAKWLLSYIATCAKCGAPLSVQSRTVKAGNVPYYRCSSSAGGCAIAPVKWLDTMATVAVIGFCAKSPLYELLTRADDRKAQAARDEAAAERDRLADFEAQAIKGQISPESFGRIAAGIEKSIAELEAKAAELSAPPALRSLATSKATQEERWADIYERWCGMPLTSRRAVVRFIFAPVLYPANGNPSDRSRFKMPLSPQLEQTSLDFPNVRKFRMLLRQSGS